MQLDVRLPMGLMFALIGAILFVYGLVTQGDAKLYAPSLGHNVNLWWGLFLAFFGGVCLFLARRSKEKPPTGEPKV